MKLLALKPVNPCWIWGVGLGRLLFRLLRLGIL